MRKLLFLLTFLLFLSFPTFGQTKNIDKINANNKENNNDLSDYIISFGEIFYINLTVATGNSIITKEPLNIFNWDIIQNNFKLPLIWDNSSFFRNQIAHPYFGSLYFNAARSNNLDFFTSFLYTISGSFMWETLIESGNISLNDLITTSFDGALTGEILYRLGCESYGICGPLSWLINPFGSLNNFIRGQQFKPTDNITEAKLSVGTGMSLYNSYQSTAYIDNSYVALPSLTGNFTIIYNDSFGHKTKELLDQFDLSLDFNFSKNQQNFDFRINGLLYSIPLFTTFKYDNNVGIVCNYDLLYSNKLFFSKSSAGITFRNKTTLNDTNIFKFVSNLNYIFPCTIDKYYYLRLKEINDSSINSFNSNYTYNHGPDLMIDFIYENKSAKISFSNNSSFLFPILADEKESFSFINNFLLSFEYIFQKNFYAGISDNLIYKYILFNDKSEVNQYMNNINIYLGYKFK